MTIDVITGNIITLREGEYTFSLLFDGRTISILAYNLETVLAEKLETVLSRNIANTRPRDYYDIHILYALRGAECNKATLRRALDRTMKKRGSNMILLLAYMISEHDPIWGWVIFGIVFLVIGGLHLRARDN